MKTEVVGTYVDKYIAKEMKGDSTPNSLAATVKQEADALLTEAGFTDKEAPVKRSETGELKALVTTAHLRALARESSRESLRDPSQPGESTSDEAKGVRENRFLEVQKLAAEQLLVARRMDALDGNGFGNVVHGIVRPMTDIIFATDGGRRGELAGLWAFASLQHEKFYNLRSYILDNAPSAFYDRMRTDYLKGIVEKLPADRRDRPGYSDVFEHIALEFEYAKNNFAQNESPHLVVSGLLEVVVAINWLAAQIYEYNLDVVQILGESGWWSHRPR